MKELLTRLNIRDQIRLLLTWLGEQYELSRMPVSCSNIADSQKKYSYEVEW